MRVIYINVFFCHFCTSEGLLPLYFCLCACHCVCAVQKKSIHYWTFHAGPPRKYWFSWMGLNFAERTGCGAFPIRWTNTKMKLFYITGVVTCSPYLLKTSERGARGSNLASPSPDSETTTLLPGSNFQIFKFSFIEFSEGFFLLCHGTYFDMYAEKKLPCQNISDQRALAI